MKIRKVLAELANLKKENSVEEAKGKDHENIITVGSLIKALSKFDPKSKLKFVAEVESGRSSSVCDPAAGSLSKEGGYVVLHVWGDETDFQ